MMTPKRKSRMLAGDIGGTKTYLGLFEAGENRPDLKILETYASQKYKSLANMIKDFLDKHPLRLDSACFGVAGPVINGTCKVTNLPWVISEDRIRKWLSLSKVKLMNDLAATAMAIPVLGGRERRALNRVKEKKGLNIGLVAPGTGLGQALLVGQEGSYIPVSSEGGHVDFAPTSETQIELWRFLHRRYGHVSVERVISGTGLWDIYSWLKQSGQYKEPAWLGQEIQNGDPPQVISKTALAKKSPICEKSLEIYVSIMGAVSGNLALTALTTGGIYLGGGIPPKILPALQNGTFMKSFTDKGRFRGLLEKIPVHVILHDQAALLGAARGAEDLINKT